MSDLDLDQWKKKAACRGLSPAVFFPPPGDRRALRVARSICEGCEVAGMCLEVGLAQTDGIFGGKTATERRRILRDFATA